MPLSRIGYINADSGVPVFGNKGCSIHVQEIINAWRKRGAQVHLFASQLGGSCISNLSSIRITKIVGISNNGSVVMNRSRLESAIRELNDSLFDQLQRDDLIARFDLIYERYSLWSFAALELARAQGIRSVLEVNAPLIEEQNRYRVSIDSPRAYEVAERAFSSANKLIAVSNEIADYLNQFSVARGKVFVIPNAVNPDRFPELTKAALLEPAATFTIGFTGSLKPWHGLDILIDAFAILSSRSSRNRLLIVGDGPERQKLESLVERKGMTDYVNFTGAVCASNIPSLLSSMNIAVAPYPQMSGFYFSPLKIFEYMAASLPIIASSIGQISLIIEHGVTGFLVPPGNANALADAIAYLQQRPDLMVRMGMAARKSACQQHTWDSVVNKIVEISE